MSTSVPQPMIPVLDELLHFPQDATKDHKAKIGSYNQLLEDVFHRELELSKLKASLLDMRQEIVEEAQTLDVSGSVIVPHPATEVGGAMVEGIDSDSAAEEVSDNSNSTGSPDKKNKKRRNSKGKFKGKGRERARISGEELGANWDYNLNLGKKHVRRSSDASQSDAEDA